MSREVQVRFCESRGVKLPPATHLGVWHNYDQVEQDKQASLRTLSWLTRRFGLLRYVDVRRTELAGGFWQQHVTELSHRGKVIRIPAALRVHCKSYPDRADRGVCRPGPVRSPGARCPRRPRLAPPTRRSGLARTRVRARLSDPWL